MSAESEWELEHEVDMDAEWDVDVDEDWDSKLGMLTLATGCMRRVGTRQLVFLAAK